MGAASAEQAGIATGAAISARLAPGVAVPEPGQLTQRCALLDVLDVADSGQPPASPVVGPLPPPTTPTPPLAACDDDDDEDERGDDDVVAALRAARPGAERMLMLGECLL